MGNVGIKVTIWALGPFLKVLAALKTEGRNGWKGAAIRKKWCQQDGQVLDWVPI